MTKPAETRNAGQGCPASRVYDRGYFESDDQTRGYRGEGYRDFAVHYATASEILKLNPKSVIEIGAGRGYISKILKNAGIEVLAMDVSPHCWHTRALDDFAIWDVTETPWRKKRGVLAPLTIGNKEFDLCFSIATLEHIPEKSLDVVIKEMARVSNRGLHAPSFPNPTPPEGTTPDDSHETLHPKEWWERIFLSVAPTYEVTIVDKEDLEFHGDMSKIMPLVPRETRPAGRRGLKKINFGSFVGQFYYGFLNVDILDMEKFAMGNGYKFMKLDVAKPIPFPNEYADLIFASHLIEHLSRDEGVRFMAECSRILKPGGVVRIATPDTKRLMRYYNHDTDLWCRARENDKKVRYDLNSDDPDGLAQFRHVNVGVAGAPTPLDAFANLALSGHKSIYDEDSLRKTMEDAGLKVTQVAMREEKKKGKKKGKKTHKVATPIDAFVSSDPIMERETIVSHPTLSMILEATK